MAPRLLPLGPLALLAFTLGLPVLVACGSRDPDAPANVGVPSPIGSGERVKQVTNPNLTNHPKSTASVSISGASYLTTDTFDETANGKSKGTVYLQDVGSSDPYSGISLFSPTFVPASLSLAPGDVVDLTGAYTEAVSIGAAVFPPGQALIQVAKPTVHFRFEYAPPTVGSTSWAPVVIQATDLDDYKTGLQWESMLVTINDVTFLDNLVNDGSGRFTAHITTDPAGPTIANELFDLNAWNQKAPTKIVKGTTYKSITGIVSWFFNFHLAPRSPDDIVVQ